MSKVIIKFKSSVGLAQVDSVKSLGADEIQIIYSTNMIIADISPDKIGKLKLNPGVEYVELDQEAHILGFDSSVQAQIPSWGIEKIRAPDVWPDFSGLGIPVCILDTGIDYNHPDLVGNYKAGFNFITNTIDPMDDNGHGTHVAGIIGASSDGFGITGVAPKCSLYSLKVLDKDGNGLYSAIITALQWAIDNKMAIVSMSFGGTVYSKALEDICNAAYNAGLLLIAAAGNSGSGNGDTVTYPARFDSVIAVGATDQNDRHASFSSVGPALELSAPGVDITSTVPTTGALGDPSGYRSLSGTSMATPHVSGTAALVFSSHPGITNAQARNMICANSIDLGTTGRDIQFGFGRIDAKAAVDNQTPPPPPPTKKYKCANGVCVEDPNGPYDSIEYCRANCKKAVIRFSCRELRDSKGSLLIKYCAYDPNGEFESLAECVNNCKKTVKKYSYSPILDDKGNQIGLSVIVSVDGQYTSDQMCQIVCAELKTIDRSG